MSHTPSEKETLETKIQKAESDIYRAKKERDSWKSGNFKSPGRVRTINTFVEAAEKDLARMRAELRKLEGKSTKQQ